MNIKDFNFFVFEDYYHPKNRVSYPALKFSNATGIKVYQDWKIPGYDIDVQRKLISVNDIGRNDDVSLIYPIEKLWKEFVDLNPEIRSWVSPGSRVHEAVQKWDIMFGMVSRYNEDDIKSFLVRKGYDVKPEERKRIEEIEKKTGVLVTWVPSIKTIKYIEDNI